MKANYVQERFPEYFIFGYSKTEDRVDVSDGNKEVLTGISRDNAYSIIKDRDKIVDFLCAIADAFDKADPEKFKKFWYG